MNEAQKELQQIFQAEKVDCEIRNGMKDYQLSIYAVGNAKNEGNGKNGSCTPLAVKRWKRAHETHVNAPLNKTTNIQ